jgi:uncharacterized membrane protein YidH (DUF202 family)
MILLADGVGVTAFTAHFRTLDRFANPRSRQPLRERGFLSLIISIASCDALEGVAMTYAQVLLVNRRRRKRGAASSSWASQKTAEVILRCLAGRFCLSTQRLNGVN